MTQATRPATIICARCGIAKAVGARGPVPVYCSGICRAAKQHSVRIEIQCAHCGTKASAASGTVYCSATCRNAANYATAKRDGRYDAALRAARQRTRERQAANARPCLYCKTPMSNPQRIQCGSPDCKRAFDAERGREWHRGYKAQTGSRYAADRYAEREREYEKRRREERPHWRTLHPERAAEYDARRRATVALARTGEAFAPRDVHERDQWTCQLCRLPVDPELAWPHSMSASVDHIIPLSRGGEHSMANVQCAHLGCNSRKGDRLLGGGEPRVAQR
ncbi:HNH endonuclease [Streptomyces nigrescens]